MTMTGKTIHVFGVCVLILFLLPAPPDARAQMVIGQYSDEAPLRTWNNYGLLSALSGGMGNVRFTLADDAAAGSVNPSLPALGASFQLAFSGSISTVSLNRYGIVNTGVLVTQSDNAAGLFPLFDAAALTFRWRGWGIGIGYGLLESYSRPKTIYEASDAGEVYYQLEFLQQGLLRNAHLALSRAFGASVSIGVGVNVIGGEWEKTVREERRTLGITITDHKTESYSGLYFTGGITVRPSSKLTLAAVVRTPFTRQSEGTSLYRYVSPLGGTDIQIPASAANRTEMPAVAGVGFSYVPSNTVRLVSDITFFLWNRYRFEYFEEELERDFKNSLKWNNGFEFINRLRLFGRNLVNPMRIGFIYDPQPMRTPSSRYLYLTLGMGLTWPHASIDFGTMFGWESGSGDNLTVYRSFISLTIHSLKGDLR